jgi:hypothetical protein
MTFTYERTISVCYSPKHDKYFEQTYEFNYCPDDESVLDAIVDLMINEANSNFYIPKEEREIMRKITKSIIEDNDLQESYENKYYDDLRDYFEEEALKCECGD